MVEVPERIWAAATPYSVHTAYAVKPPEQYLVGYTEYVRADLLAGYGKLDAENAVLERQIAELRAERDEARSLYNHAITERDAAEAENARLRALPLKDEVEALEPFAALGEWEHLPGTDMPDEFEPFLTRHYKTVPITIGHLRAARALRSRLRAGEQEGRDGLSEWAGWDKTRDPWSETKHKDAVLEALFRGPWSVEDAAALIGFIDRTWTRRPSAPSHQGGDRG